MKAKIWQPIEPIVFMLIIYLSGCWDYTIANKIELREDHNTDSEVCCIAEKDTIINCMNEKVEYGCKVHVDKPDGRWQLVKVGREEKTCWARLDWFDSKGELFKKNEEIANKITNESFEKYFKKANDALTKKQYYDCYEYFDKIDHLKRHKRIDEAIRKKNQCEYMMIKIGMADRKRKERRKRSNNKYEECRRNSERLRRAITLEYALKIKKQDRFGENVFEDCLKEFIAHYFGIIRTSKYDKNYVIEIRKELEKCCKLDLNMSNYSYRKTIDKRWKSAREIDRDPRRTHYKYDKYSWLDRPDVVEVELRYPSNRGTFENGYLTKDTMWTVITLRFCEKSWYVDMENALLDRW